MSSDVPLVQAFNEWHWASNCFHDHVLQFALQNRDQFTASPGGEHSHVVYQLHQQFQQQMEAFVQAFLDHHGTSMEAFEAALIESRNSPDLYTQMSAEVVTDEVFSLLDYDAFIRTMLKALADESTERPEAREALEAMAAADVPEARAVLLAMEQAVNESELLYDGSPPAPTIGGSQRLQITVPEGVGEGQDLRVTAPNGQTLSVQVPAGLCAGQTFEVEYAPAG